MSSDLGRVYIAGRYGMVGRAIEREMSRNGTNVFGKSSTELDLRNRNAVEIEFEKVRPKTLVISAAKVGGILSNSNFPVDFLSTNLQIQTNLLDLAFKFEIENVLFLGSSCIYPKLAQQPIVEESLLTGSLEETNEAYAIAKIAGVKLIQAYRKQYGLKWISGMPTNLYGSFDNFNLNSSHVIPGLIHKFHNAKTSGNESVTIWGDGTPLREFMYVDDLARACLFLLDSYDNELPINIGSGEEVTIAQLAHKIANTVGYEGLILYDKSKPNGTPRKFLDSSRLLSHKWDRSKQINLDDGLALTYNWFLGREYKE